MIPRYFLFISAFLTLMGGTMNLCGCSPTSESTDLEKMKSFPVQHEAIFFNGWHQLEVDSSVTFSHSGVYFDFMARSQMVKVEMEHHGPAADATTNYFRVLVDGQTTQKFKLKSGKQTVDLAEGIDDSFHRIQVFKCTEAMVGKVSVHQIYTDSLGELKPAKRAPRRIRFIGNSLTCGYGNDTIIPAPPEGEPATGFHSKYEDNYLAFGAITARKLNADFEVIAYSGKGVYRNFTGDQHLTIPEQYPRVHPEDPNTAWASPERNPDVMVICLGTNDMARDPEVPLTGDKFLPPYEAFASSLLEQHPNSALVICLSGSLKDVYPPGARHRTRMRQWLRILTTKLSSVYEGRVSMHEFMENEAPYGEDYHPAVHMHKKMAASLVAHLQKELGW